MLCRLMYSFPLMFLLAVSATAQNPDERIETRKITLEYSDFTKVREQLAKIYGYDQSAKFEVFFSRPQIEFIGNENPWKKVFLRYDQIDKVNGESRAVFGDFKTIDEEEKKAKDEVISKELTPSGITFLVRRRSSKMKGNFRDVKLKVSFKKTYK